MEIVDQRLPAAGLELRVRSAGEGPPILLLHGFPDAGTLWDPMLAGLVAAGHRVVVPDQRGFGESAAPAEVAEYRIDRIVADHLAVLDRLCPGEPVRVIGHDWGAVVAWCLALAHPHRVRALVALSVGHPRAYATAGLEQKRKGLYTLAFQFRGLAEHWLSRDDFAGLRRWAGQHPALAESVAWMSRPGRLAAGLAWYRANLVRVLFRAWPPCDVPALGVWSSGDRFLSEDQMTGSARHMQAPWRYQRIEGAGHWLPLEQPDRMNALALAWFREHAG